MANRKRAYPEIYLADFAFSVGTLFQRAAEKRVDCIATINTLLNSRIFHDITDWGSSRGLNMGSWQLLDCVKHEEMFDWDWSKRKKKYDPEIMWWVGRTLETFRWAYKIDFRDWLKYDSVENIYNIYYPLHEASFRTAADKLMDRYLWRKLEALPEGEKAQHLDNVRYLVKRYPELRAEIAWLSPDNQE